MTYYIKIHRHQTCVIFRLVCLVENMCFALAHKNQIKKSGHFWCTNLLWNEKMFLKRSSLAVLKNYQSSSSSTMCWNMEIKTRQKMINEWRCKIRKLKKNQLKLSFVIPKLVSKYALSFKRVIIILIKRPIFEWHLLKSSKEGIFVGAREKVVIGKNEFHFFFISFQLKSR